MSKIKISFSLLFTLLLVGMFSVVAFAAVPTTPKLYGTYSESNAIAIQKFNTDVTATGYKIRLDGVDLPDILPADLKDNGHGTLQYAIELTGGQTSATAHTVEVAVVNAEGTSPYASYTLQASQGPLPSVSNGAGTPDFDKAHKDTTTGLHDQKVHGSYQNNTSSCASCHQTHTGADTNLLFKNGTSATCNACHDGTLGAYDVNNSISNAGIFAGDTAGSGDSMHNVGGVVQISAAPGGGSVEATWSSEFTCASCHNPHGSDSSRLLNNDPMGWGSVDRATNPLGNLYKTISINPSVPTLKVSATADYILVNATVDTSIAPYLGNAKFTGVPNGSKILLTYKWDPKGAKYSIDYTLWLRTQLKFNGATPTTGANLIINYKDGYAYGSDLTTTPVVTAQVGFGIGVDMFETTSTVGNLTVAAVDNRAYFDSAYAGKYIADSGNQMSKFCSACHNDYLSVSHGQVTGVHTTAFRHITTGDSYTCVRCHFAHGTEPEAMKDSMDRDVTKLQLAPNATNPENGGLGLSAVDALKYLTDQMPSSANKRYVGNAVCFGCHGPAIVGDDITRANLPTDGKQPGTR